MAESKSVAVVSLNGSNFPTWNIQCRMALLKDGLWSIVSGTEVLPAEGDARTKFLARRDRALAIIVLSVQPSLLYLLGEPEDPVVVWKKLSDQFQKKTWANKLELRRRLYSLRLKERDSVQEHIRKMTEVFDELAVIGDPVDTEDRVVHLLASLPESYSVLVTALEASAEVPKMEVVTERLLHVERKQKDREGEEKSHEKAMAVTRLKVKCHYCGKRGHIKRDCYSFKRKQSSQGQRPQQKANKAATKKPTSDEEGDVLIVTHALQAGLAGNWIVDSGATCHMCTNKKMFVDLKTLEDPMEVTLGDGRALQAVGRGVVPLMMKLPSGVTRKCNMQDVLYVPALSYNLMSVSQAAERGKVTEFNSSGCQIRGSDRRLIANATRVGSLYYLDCEVGQHTSITRQDSNTLWHQRFGHLNERSLQKLARDEMVKGLDFSYTKENDFCETCIEGKHKKSTFPTSGSSRATQPLGLVHSDLCGKINARSFGGAEYFLTFIDDCTHYTWVYMLKHKNEVFDCFLCWKALVEKSSGRKLKTIRTDNGGEYTSTAFEEYLTSEGIRHERTIPRTPEQNGIAERMNRTLVETVRSMLFGARLPHAFWAEALSTAVYLRNRSPTKAVQGMTPYEAWIGEKPVVKHLRVFGCNAYAHVPKEERGKLDSKAKKCTFVGYGNETKGYRLFDTVRQKIIFSRDVVFNEQEYCSGSQVPEGDAGHHVELELSSDEPPEEVQDTQPAESGNEQHTSPQVIRRSSRTKYRPNFYGYGANFTQSQTQEPQSVEAALSTPEKAKWLEAMEKEMNSLEKNNVWELVELPSGRKHVGSKWVFKVKTDEDGNVERFKARLVAQGFTQKFGTDYDETFCPVVRQESIRTLIALSVQHGLQLHQVDITTAFLNGDLEEEVFMSQPEGFVDKDKEHLVCKLKKSLYGLKQSPRCWNSALDKYLKEIGFIQAESDPCIYRASSGKPFFLGVYVDDIVMASESCARLEEVKSSLAKKFDIKDLGRLHHFLGMKVIQDEATGNVWVGQQTYTNDLLQKFGMEAAKPVATPVDTSTKLVKATENDESTDQQEYQSAVGSLLYLAMATRPDIAFAVSSVAKFSAHPSKLHWTAVKRILRYLKGTADYGLAFTPCSSGDCIGYSDSDWGGDLNDRKSTSGYVFLLSGCAVSWRSKKQSCVALSTAEAEYVALASAAQEAVWMGELTAQFSDRSPETITIYEDNQSAISMAKNPQFHGRTKHISIKYHFIREQVDKKAVELKYCPTEEMVADMLTKGLAKEQFQKLRLKAGVTTYHNLCSGRK